MSQQPRKFGVQSSRLTKAIHVGRISKDGKRFLDGKEDHAASVFYAVGQYAIDHYDGGMVVKVGGLRIEIEARPIEEGS